ncbi:hypothetical protein HOF78_01605 [Candidatus Woesearchaeota archaeon]|jgi:hypothetical protein|nr:hypothetical protein [Candidatus Woesearchaeota archaeon]MBT6044799.1 hypothetical protein [Candidatus Woesearchaeota archaeon]
MKKLSPGLLLAFLALPKAVSAHCPLCTIGAGAAAAGAAYLGVSGFIIGLFIGAAGLALGLWTSKLIKKKYIPFQSAIIALIIFLSITIPVLPLIQSYSSIYISWFGDYGSLLNKTYLINLFLIGSIFGALILSATPYLSKKLTKLRSGKFIPFQGIILTFSILVVVALLSEVIL